MSICIVVCSDKINVRERLYKIKTKSAGIGCNFFALSLYLLAHAYDDAMCGIGSGEMYCVYFSTEKGGDKGLAGGNHNEKWLKCLHTHVFVAESLMATFAL